MRVVQWLWDVQWFGMSVTLTEQCCKTCVWPAHFDPETKSGLNVPLECRNRNAAGKSVKFQSPNEEVKKGLNHPENLN
jgi:hypothetical protein